MSLHEAKKETASSERAPPVDETSELDAVLKRGARDQRAWNAFVRKYDPPLRAVVRHAAEAVSPLDDAQVGDVLGDFWLRLVENDLRPLRTFNPSRGSSLLTWLTFHVAQVAYEHLHQKASGPKTVPLAHARNVADPRPLPSPRFRNELPRSTIEEAIGEVVRHAVAAELQKTLAPAVRAAGHSAPFEEGFISIARAAELADTHPSTIRAWIRAGKLAGGRTGRHYKVRRADLIAVIQGEADPPAGSGERARMVAEFMAKDRLKP
jgi:excisionase family DNA binding protein